MSRHAKPTHDDKIVAREVREELRTILDTNSGRHSTVAWTPENTVIVGPEFGNQPFKNMTVNFID